MKKLAFINQVLSQYEQEMKNAYILNDSLLMERLLAKTLNFPIFSFSPFCDPTFISREYTIILMKRFLGELDDRLLKQFCSLLDDGCIKWISSTTSIHKAGYRGTIPFIHLSFSSTLQDFIVLVHEFFHLTNRKFSSTSYPATRETLSEFVSIYFEKQAISFLEKEGYSPLELSFFRQKRWRDTYYTVHRYHFENIIWKVYQKDGSITSFNTPYKLDKIYRYFKRYTFSPFKKMVYILGDILSEYVIELDISFLKILELNSSLNDYSIFMALEQIGGSFDFSKVEQMVLIYQDHVQKNLSSCQ